MSQTLKPNLKSVQDELMCSSFRNHPLDGPVSNLDVEDWIVRLDTKDSGPVLHSVELGHSYISKNRLTARSFRSSSPVKSMTSNGLFRDCET